LQKDETEASVLCTFCESVQFAKSAARFG